MDQKELQLKYGFNMQKLKAIITDDEKSSRIVLKNLLANFCPEVEVVGEAGSVEEAYVHVDEVKPELMFLDIQMPNGNGFTLLQRYEQIPFDVVFITSYDQYAINAIRFNALDYLLKPIVITELQDAVKKAISRRSSLSFPSSNMNNLIQNMGLDLLEQRIAFHKNDQVRYIPVKNISHIKSDGNYSIVITDNNELFSSSKTLKEYDDYLSSFPGFIRIHRNCVINVRMLKSYSKTEPCVITMDNGETLEISRRKKQEVLESLKSISPRV
jgi:two-component system, LytTR family, response regulator